MMALAFDSLSPEWWKALEATGAVPKYVKRMIIDVQLDKPVKVYFECHGDDTLFGVVPTLLEGAQIVCVDDAPPKET